MRWPTHSTRQCSGQWGISGKVLWKLSGSYFTAASNTNEFFIPVGEKHSSSCQPHPNSDPYLASTTGIPQVCYSKTYSDSLPQCFPISPHPPGPGRGPCLLVITQETHRQYSQHHLDFQECERPFFSLCFNF